MSLTRLFSRTAKTAVRLPFAMAWDVISLGNMGDGTSTGRVLQEHSERKHLDDAMEALQAAAEIRAMSTKGQP